MIFSSQVALIHNDFICDDSVDVSWSLLVEKSKTGITIVPRILSDKITFLDPEKDDEITAKVINVRYVMNSSESGFCVSLKELSLDKIYYGKNIEVSITAVFGCGE